MIIMKNKGKRWLYRTLLLTMLFLAALPVSVSAKIKLSSKKLSLLIGQTSQLNLNGLTDTEQPVEWKVQRKKIASVSQSGEVTAEQKGTTKIYAVTGGKKYSCKLTVKQPVTDIRLNKTRKTLTKGKTYRLKTTVGPEDANNTAVKWKSSDKSVAKVSSKGKVTAVGAGTATITASAKDGGGAEASCEITVKLEPIELNMTQLTLKVGKKAQLKASEGYTYAWATSDKSVATVSKTGKVKAKKAGNAVIVAMRVDDLETVCCYVTVTSSGKDSDKSETENDEISDGAAKFLKLMEKYAKRLSTDIAAGKKWVYGGNCARTWKNVKSQSKKGTVYLSCVQMAQWGLRELGIISNGDFKGVPGGDFRIVDKEQLLKSCKIIKVNSMASELIESGKLLPGDICSYVNIQHTNVYAGDGKWYDSGRMGSNGSYVNGTYVFSTLGPIEEGDMLIGSIVRIVK